MTIQFPVYTFHFLYSSCGCSSKSLPASEELPVSVSTTLQPTSQVGGLTLQKVEVEVEAEEIEAEEVEAERVQVKEVEAEEVETEDAEEEYPKTTIVNEVGNENSIFVENSDNGVKGPDIIPVYCIATLENCPDSGLNEEYGESIRRFLLSEQHLVQNISSVDLQHLSSRSFRNNSHMHTVSVTIYVRTTRLWESPSNYVRKHLGLANYWERSNGTIVKLSRIHQKQEPFFLLSQNTVIYN